MSIKSLFHKEVTESTPPLTPPNIEQKTDKSKVRGSANQINAWSNNELVIGELDDDLKEILDRAKTGSLKGKRVGTDQSS